jgi:hypothetical protein
MNLLLANAAVVSSITGTTRSMNSEALTQLTDAADAITLPTEVYSNCVLRIKNLLTVNKVSRPVVRVRIGVARVLVAQSLRQTDFTL